MEKNWEGAWVLEREGGKKEADQRTTNPMLGRLGEIHKKVRN